MNNDLGWGRNWGVYGVYGDAASTPRIGGATVIGDHARGCAPLRIFENAPATMSRQDVLRCT